MKIILATVIALAWTMGATAAETASDSATDFLPPLTNGQRWQLTWHDEFNDSQIDTNKWQIMGDSRRRDDW